MSLLQPVKESLKSAKQWMRYQGLPASSPASPGAARGTATCVISAADPGGLGDAAMIRVITDQYGDGGVDVTSWSHPDAPPYPDTRAQVDIGQLRGAQAESVLRGYARFACVGADVMDGLYAYADSCLRLRLLGLSAALGLDSRLLGFSFNAKPHPKTVLEFKRLHPDVVICVRDPISHERLSAVIDRDPRLVADMAFLVQAREPGGQARQTLDWAADQRRQGRRVIGLNVHPMFSFDHGPGITPALIDAFVSMVRGAPDIAFVLIPHDFRPVFGDLPMLQTLQQSLSQPDQARVRLVSEIRDPGELKGFVGNLDGVLTGRMHLAIAAMGKGVPVGGITYQGKFEGLLQHFNLGGGLTIAPPDAADAGKLATFFKNWVAQLDAEARVIRQGLPAVVELARRNFA